MARFGNILETIGNTPLVKLNKLAPVGVNVYVKIEAFNPMGSVKDRTKADLDPYSFLPKWLHTRKSA